MPLSRQTEVISVRRVMPDGSEATQRIVPIEMPIAVSFSGIGYAVMMASPNDLEDFAYGFALAERLIETARDVEHVAVREAENGLLLQVELADSRRDLVFQRVRHRIGETSCGLCGIENLEQALRPLPRAPAPPHLDRRTIFAALADLRSGQPLNESTGAVHAAALVSASGEIVAAREDIGRHNAFDKLIGHCLRNGLDRSSGFALLTSRCSYELVEKAAVAGFGLLVTVSAPTSLAIRRAADAGLTLVALARRDAMLVLSDPHHLFD